MTNLIPVAEWTWNLYRVTYHLDENDLTPRLTKHLVTTNTHVQGEICETEGAWPTPSYRYARWEPVKENVARPRSIGSIYGMRLDESAWSAGEREAEQLLTPA
jgi:hypothetical protein